MEGLACLGSGVTASPSVDGLADLLGTSPAMEGLRRAIRRLTHRIGGSGRPPAVLVTGETGTGKGLVARLLHRLGPRANGPFVDVNCAAVPETLLEAELFGFERGAFTDARRSKPGLFQVAHGGTIFLDEIGLLGEPLQAKLLTVVEERVVRRLGATRPEPVDVCLISATNAHLSAAIQERRFREDLYHRLAVVTLAVPPLRDRLSDVILLAEHFLAHACHEYGLPVRTLTEDARRRLLTYSWPGNVRQLANVMARAVLMTDSSVVTAANLDLAPPPSSAAPGVGAPTPGALLEHVVRTHVRAVLEECAGNVSRAAAALGIARNTLNAYIRRFGLEVRILRGRPPLQTTTTAPARCL
jgi:transcriptional regulator with PAS, ATPase and Fis domain